MTLNETPAGERVHIGFFGLRNAGKSSLVNAVTGQELAVVSDVEGTTTDPVRKAMELLPLGPVVVIDTPGMDDVGELGQMRVEKARQVLRKCDIAVLVVDATRGMQPADQELHALIQERSIPCVLAWNKADLLDGEGVEALVDARPSETPEAPEFAVSVSALTGEGVWELKERIASFAKELQPQKRLVADLVDPGDMVVLVVPIDESAPKGRLILPQQMVMRDLLDAHAAFVTCQPEELAGVLETLGRAPKFVITDSQVFSQAAEAVPENVPLTSFSILMARFKGDLPLLLQGAQVMECLKDGDRVLVAEGCTHHRQCEDIGTVKIPRWVRELSGAEPEFIFTSGGDFPADLSGYKLVIHCGGCMLNQKEMAYRMQQAKAAGVPMVNYGVAIAHIHGILERSVKVFDL